jgi:predicted ATPase
MITKWKLGNFRSIRDYTEIDFAPLTLFAGANSSGKSTILKSILLIAQTLSHKDHSRPLVLNGDLIKLGNINDNISDNSTSKTLVIGWECLPFNDTLLPFDEILKRKIHCEIAVAPSDSESYLPTGDNSGIDLCRFHFGLGNHYSLNVKRSDILTIGWKEKWIQNTSDKDIRNALSYNIEDRESHIFHKDDFSKLPCNTVEEEYKCSAIGCIFQNFLPAQLVIGDEWTDKSKNNYFNMWRGSLPPQAKEATQYIKEYFSKSLHYLGPLRASSKSLYARFSNLNENTIGLKGENTPEVFEAHKRKIIRYIPSLSFDTSGNIPELIECSLENALDDWLGYLGIAEKIEVTDKGKYGLELGVKIGNGNKINDITQVGVGVSQVLPILVSGLLAETDTTLIFEQPELHLHPKVQSRLADFFLSMTQLGKQCLVETHSEHIINRIRLRIAEGSEGSPWHDAAKVYFVENKNDSSTFREIKIDECGSILDWPEGFFDENESAVEKITKAAIKKRNGNSRNN